MIMRLQHADDTAFGHAVNLDQSAGPAPDHLGFQLRRKRCAGAEFYDGAGQVEIIEVAHRHQSLILDRHQHRVRHFVGYGMGQIGVHVELLHHPRKATVAHGRQENRKCGVRIQRRRNQ